MQDPHLIHTHLLCDTQKESAFAKHKYRLVRADYNSFLRSLAPEAPLPPAKGAKAVK